MVELAAKPDEPVSDAAIQYMNRLSDFLFVASRAANDNGAGRRALGARPEPLTRHGSGAIFGLRALTGLAGPLGSAPKSYQAFYTVRVTDLMSSRKR